MSYSLMPVTNHLITYVNEKDCVPNMDIIFYAFGRIDGWKEINFKLYYKLIDNMMCYVSDFYTIFISPQTAKGITDSFKRFSIANPIEVEGREVVIPYIEGVGRWVKIKSISNTEEYREGILPYLWKDAVGIKQ